MVLSVSLAFAAALIWLFSMVDPADIQDFVAEFGPRAPAVYMGLFALLPAVFFPVAVLALAGGLPGPSGGGGDRSSLLRRGNCCRAGTGAGHPDPENLCKPSRLEDRAADSLQYCSGQGSAFPPIIQIKSRLRIF